MKIKNYRSGIIISFLIIITFLLSSCSQKKVEQKITNKPKVIYDSFGFVKNSLIVKKDSIKRNETLADLLLSLGLTYPKITELVNKAKPVFDFRKIRPNRKYIAYLNRDSVNTLNTFIYEIDRITYVKVQFGDSLKITKADKKVTIKEKSIAGIINNSLYQTLIEENASPMLAVELADVFAWQIDFYTIQKGDKFFAVFTEKYVDDEFVGVGKILTAEFIHKGNTYKAFLFNQNGKDEYFDEEGKSLQKEFLKAPLKYRRISSRFSRHRLHPIFRVYRPHLGIDYAAAIGTPVQAVGDGIVILRQRKRGAGRFVKIRHNSVYTSGYMHLSKYGNGIRVGARVKQGQVIGYVGQSGHATGPHLDFRFYKNGRAVNYLTQKFPSSKSVTKENMPKFLELKNSLMKKLKNFDNKSKKIADKTTE